MIRSDDPPSHFLPRSCPAVREYFWHALAIENLTPREAVRRHVARMANSQIEQEFMNLLADSIQEQWNEVLAVEAIQRIA